MKLRTYIAEKEMSIKEFSEKLGITRSYLSEILSGKYKPGKLLMKTIQEITDGQVGKEDVENLKRRKKIQDS